MQAQAYSRRIQRRRARSAGEP